MKKVPAIDWKWVKEELFRQERIRGSKEISAHAGECLDKAKALARPRVISLERKIISLSPGSFTIDGPITFKSPRVSSHIAGAVRLYIFLATIGPDLERQAGAWMSGGEELRGYMLDRTGSIAVESLAEDTERALRSGRAGQGESVSMRFSPGYCDWPLEEQRTMDTALDFSKAGVSLTGAYMMVPRKSVSAVMAIGPGGLFKEDLSPCAVCGKGDCDYRRGLT